MPHSRRDEEDYIEALETVRATLTEGRKMETVDFYKGGDFNIDMKLGNTGEDRWRLDSIEWCGMSGHECGGGGENVMVTVVEGVHLHGDEHWRNTDDMGGHHTWRAWGSRIRKKRLDCHRGPRDINLRRGP